MPLIPATNLGPYEILSPLGVGGMGEVYRARDTRLGRTVAIKVLPSAFRDRVDLRKRLEREAQALSNLSHPHICHLYDIGEQDGLNFLVMEFLEGETLATRLARGPLPLEQLLKLGVHITSALESAHRHGIIHRDLKPGNIMLTKNGAKLLDFGLARMELQHEAISETLAALPTRDQKLTEDGVILGTFQYMAPEQVEGKNADARTDIFAFGTVLYEMATARPAFSGKTRASLIASILVSEPVPMSTLQPLTPPALERVVKFCVAKDPDARWQSAQDLKVQLEWILEGGSQVGVPVPVSRRRKKREQLVWILAGLFAVALAVFGIRDYERSRQTPPVIRFEIFPPEQHSFNDLRVRVSPDGRKLAIGVTDAEGKTSLWSRSLDDAFARELPGTDSAGIPIWSGDSRFLLFLADGKLKKTDTQGGLPDVLCDVKKMDVGSLSSAGTLLLSHSVTIIPEEQRFPIWQMNSDDCSLSPATKLDAAQYDLGHHWPRFLPDGQHFVYAGLRTDKKHDVLLSALGNNSGVVLVRNGSNPQYAAGYLFFERNGYLFAQPFDLGKLRVTSEPLQVVPEQLSFSGISGVASYDVSNNVLVYQSQSGVSNRLIVTNDQGRELEKLADSKAWDHVLLSPDGKMLLASQDDTQTHTSDLWIYSLQHKKWRRFSFEQSVAFHAGVWSPDEQTIAYAANVKHQTLSMQLYRKAVDQTGDPEPLLISDVDKLPTDWSRDGRYLLYTQWDPTGQADLWVLPMTQNHKPIQLTMTPFDEMDGRFSPDGRWVAYSSNESGGTEVYVRPFPGPGNRIAVSSGGGSAPQWSRDGKTLFYLTPDWKLMVTSLILRGTSIQPSASRVLFSIPPNSEYNLLPGGNFLINEQIGNLQGPVIVTLNWRMTLRHQ